MPTSHRSILLQLPNASILAVAAMLFAGCQTDKPTTAITTPPVVPPPPVNASGPVALLPAAIRINAGAETPVVDASGHTWLPDQGFNGGDIIDRGEVTIANTPAPALYRTERYSMNSFSQKLPNGRYVVKLHFAETYEGITGAGDRVFSFNIEGREFKDFDVFAKAGGPNKAYVETVTVEVADGQLDIVFTSNIENPEINGIEILPAS